MTLYTYIYIVRPVKSKKNTKKQNKEKQKSTKKKKQKKQLQNPQMLGTSVLLDWRR